jgi:hypothetical protein
MRLKTILTWLPNARRVLGGLVAAVLLLPMPAMAITFLGVWMPVSPPSVSGTPAPPTPTFMDVPTGDPQKDTLDVIMGDYQGSGVDLASSSISLTRQFQITSGAQVLQFDHNALAQFAQAGENVTLQVKNSSGALLFTPVSFAYSNGSSSFVSVPDSETYRTALANGTYTLVATVRFNTNNKLGGWKTMSSPHVFDIQGF